MGYIAHHAIVVTVCGYYFGQREELLPGAEAVRDLAAETFGPDAVSEWVSSPVNSYRSFFIAPDGSKEGWEASDTGNALRAEFFRRLEEHRYDDGSSPVRAVEVYYPEDATGTVTADMFDSHREAT